MQKGVKTKAVMLEEPKSGLRRVTAPNPSPMTQAGTNTYLVGQGEVAVIDPGPDMPAHMGAILAALRPGERITHILVTHSHLDHSALAPALAQHTGADIHAFGDSRAGRNPLHASLGELGGGEAVHDGFAPDRSLGNGDIVRIGDEEVRAYWTPGHFGNHLAFQWREVVFTGDTVMGWASSLISPPDGDLGAYMRSLDLLQALDASCLYPGHGSPITDPAKRISWLRAHRRDRESQILAELSGRARSAGQLVAKIYRDTDPRLHGAAKRNVLAHLIDLKQKNVADHEGDLTPNSVFRLL